MDYARLKTQFDQRPSRIVRSRLVPPFSTKKAPHLHAGCSEFSGSKRLDCFAKCSIGFGDWFSKRWRRFLSDVLLYFIAFGLLEAFCGMDRERGYKTTVFILRGIG